MGLTLDVGELHLTRVPSFDVALPGDSVSAPGRAHLAKFAIHARPSATVTHLLALAPGHIRRVPPLRGRAQTRARPLPVHGLRLARLLLRLIPADELVPATELRGRCGPWPCR